MPGRKLSTTADLPWFPVNPTLLPRGNASEKVAALHLWGAAWRQTPTATLPNDDRQLCQLAGLEDNMRKWKRVRERALQGFELGEDGRLYHPLLLDLAAKVLGPSHRTNSEGV